MREEKCHILLVDLSNHPVDSIFSRLVVTVHEGVRVAVQVGRCKLLLMTCRDNLKCSMSANEGFEFET